MAKELGLDLEVDGVHKIGRSRLELTPPAEYLIAEGQGGLLTPEGDLYVWTIPPDRSQEIWQMPPQKPVKSLQTIGIMSCCGLTTEFAGYKLLLHGRYTIQLIRMLQYGLYLADDQHVDVMAIDTVDLYTHNQDPKMNYVGGVQRFFAETLGKTVTVVQHGEALPFNQLQGNPMSASI